MCRSWFLASSARDLDGDLAGGEAGDPAERGRCQVHHPVPGAQPVAAAVLLAAEEVGLRTAVGDPYTDRRVVAPAGDREEVPATPAQQAGAAAAVRAGDRVAGVGKVGPGALQAARVAR